MKYEGIKLTEEQATAINYMKSGKDTGVQAPAGSGKTFILKAGSSEIGGKRGTYLAFNKAIADEAKATFPGNVDCRTGHSLAFGAVGREYAHRLKPFPGFKLANEYNIGETRQFPTRTAKGYLILDTIRNYCYSDDEELTVKNIPYIGDKITDIDTLEFIYQDLPVQANYILDLMKDKTNDIPVTHDFYLKLWALSKPRIGKDFLLFDEAQDANQVILGVMNNQTHMQKIFVGDRYQQIYCQPAGTIITIGNEKRKKPISFLPIEQVTTGMNVVTYKNNAVYKQGKKVNHITKLKYKGELVVASTKTKQSKYIPKHQCIVRIGDELKGKYIVYIMKKENNYRIGKIPYFYNSITPTFGLAARSRGEGAECSWILSIHDSSGEALMYEALYQTTYSIPSMRFAPGVRDVVNTGKFWEKLGDNSKQGVHCLESFGLLKEFPIWTEGYYAMVGVRRPFITAAANLHNGMKMLPLDKNIPHKKSYVPCWKTIEITNEYYNGYVYSLEVAEHHTYYADGLLTHNSWRGAKNAMINVKVDNKAILSQSFRFGQAIADVANKILQGYTPDGENPTVIIGNPRQSSSVEEINGAPDAIICRTNSGVIGNVFRYIAEGYKVYIQGGPNQLISLIKGADALRNGRKTGTQELALFSTWEELVEYSESSSDGKTLKLLIKLMDNYGAQELLEMLKRTQTNSKNSDITLTTAHKAKGLEWDKVKLGDDFMYPTKEGQIMPSGEVNVLYVAATRALKILDITNCIAANVDYVMSHLEKD